MKNPTLRPRHLRLVLLLLVLALPLSACGAGGAVGSALGGAIGSWWDQPPGIDEGYEDPAYGYTEPSYDNRW